WPAGGAGGPAVASSSGRAPLAGPGGTRSPVIGSPPEVEVRGGRGHPGSATARWTSVFSPLYVAPPITRAVIRPLREITSVVGIPAGGTVLRKSRARLSLGSLRLGQVNRKLT